MREIGISPRFSRDKFVPLQTKQRYSTRDISGKVFLTLFFRGFVPFLSLADFVSRDKNLQVVDLQRLKPRFEELVTATTSNHQKGVAFLRMRHLFGTNATLEQGKWTPPLNEKHYFCGMKELFETMPDIKLALIIIGVSVLIVSLLLGYAMINDYRMYLEDHWKARYTFRDFLKRERFYIFLLLATIFIILTNLLYFLE